MHEYYIGSNGAIMFGSDSASTDSTHFTKIIVALAQVMGLDVAPRSDSPVKDIAYNHMTHELTWSDNDVAQSVTVQHPKLVEFLDDAFASAAPTSLGVQLGRIEAAIQAEHDLNLGAYNNTLDLKEVAYGHSTALGNIESKVDVNKGLIQDTYNKTLDLAQIAHAQSTTLGVIERSQQALEDVPNDITVLQKIMRRVEAIATWIAIPRLRLRDQVIGLRRFVTAFVEDFKNRQLDEDEIRVSFDACKQAYTHPRKPGKFVFFFNNHTEPKDSDETDN